MKQYLLIVVATLSLFLVPTTNLAKSHSHHMTDSESHRPDSHAPIGVMGGHTHKKGELMVSYKYMWMEMNEVLEQRTVLNTSEVLEKYMVSPVNMTMSMQMGGVMYAPSDRVTFMGMVPVIRKSMDHKHRNGSTFTRNANGLGDIKVLSLINVVNTEKRKTTHCFWSQFTVRVHWRKRRASDASTIPNATRVRNSGPHHRSCAYQVS
ncbi:hypothetical protein DID80_06350 [Candidatus Marinamargulisbacteria bacterium SCGC AAA071-K20]|nr:hypothetical protein DID80_06350 [Candidatus Marinamargulisbacteria bacterium SCGC AAA071-K20]